MDAPEITSVKKWFCNGDIWEAPSSPSDES